MEEQKLQTESVLQETPAIDTNSADSLLSKIPNPEHDMEVHHHTHEPHGKKTWKNYFWEFLMLFLAVFCGFLAEYKLEHVIEDQRENNYMQAILKETASDISEYDTILKRLYNIDPIADSLFQNVKNAEKYGFNLMSKWNTPMNNFSVNYSPSLTAIQQLKYSGNMRLIKSQELVLQIVTYQTVVETSLKNSKANLQEAQRTIYKFENNYCDLADFNNSLSSDIKKNTDRLKLDEAKPFEMPILVKDPIKLNELASSFVDFRGYLNGYVIAVNEAKQKAISLAEKIKEEYHPD